MGAGQSLNQKAMYYGVQYFNDDCWKISESILKKTSSTAKLHVIDELCKPIATYSSPKHAYLIDQYLLGPTEIINFDEYFREIEWRNQCEYLVNVKYIKGFSTSTICQTSAPKNYLYIQHIPLRLSQITDIPFPENLCLLKTCLKGFYYIYLHTRALDIKEDQICLNQQGKVKVWMNADLAKSTPCISNIFRTSRKTQLTLVKEIIDMIDENTDHQFEPKNFKQYLKEKKLQNLTFVESIQAVQQFANALLVTIPMSLVSVNDLFDPLLNSNRIISNNQVNNSYSIGRGAQTNETKMIQSIPIQNEEYSAHHYTNHSEPHFIKYLDTYNCQREGIAARSTLPFKTIQYPIKVNYVTKSAVNKFENVINFHSNPSYTTPKEKNIENEQKCQMLVKDEDEQWKYFDLNGWLDIDPEILRDLKSINTSS